MTSPGGPSAVGETTTGDAGTSGADRAGASIDQSARSATGEQAAASASRQAYDPGPIWALALPPLLVLALSFWNITTPSFWRDEAATIAAVRRPFGDLLSMLGNVDAVHSAYYIMMWPLAHLFGTGELVMRLPSALAAAVTAAFVA